MRSPLTLRAASAATLFQAELTTAREAAEQARARERGAQRAAREAQKRAREASKSARQLAAVQNEAIQRHVQKAVARATVDRERILVRLRAQLLQEQPQGRDSGGGGHAIGREREQEQE